MRYSLSPRVLIIPDGEALVVHAERTRDDTVLESDRRLPARVLSNCKTAHRFLRHVETTTRAFRREKYQIPRRMVDRVRKRRIEPDVRLSAHQVRLAVILGRRLS